jgi:hypothetical protein
MPATNPPRSPIGRDISSQQGRVIDAFTWRSYYSGADVRFEFDDIPVDDVCGISWKLIEPTKFHYGYASRFRLRSSKGTRMVSGQLMMNYRDPLSFHALLQAIRQKARPGSFAATPSDIAVLGATVGSGKITPAQAARQIAPGGRGSSLTGLTPESPATTARPDPERLRAYRDALWGTGNGNDPLYKDRKAAMPPDGLTEEEILETQRDPDLLRAETQMGIGLLGNGQDITGTGRAARFRTGPDGFNIRMIFGEPGQFAYQARSDQAGRQVGAVQLLKGVEIMSSGTEISETGDPIRTVYEFVAADVF